MSAPTHPLAPEGNSLLAEHPPEIGAIERRLRELIFEEMPDALEIVDTRNKLLAYSLGSRMRDLAFAIIAHKAHVNLQLADGVDLADRDEIVEGTGKRIRHVKCRSLEECERPALRKLMREQVARRRESAPG
ncbi:MAG TPA: DUF1801 domain-containing protein [Candidatus Limnocylindrales bacterium]|nr:DUF1801 domain-containing protein [Candidatus Limnocylindrales bacterium]